MPVDFSELRAVQSRIQAAAGRAPAVAAAVTRASAHAIEAIAKSNAPVITGDLRDKIHAVQVGASAWEVRSDSDHGGYVEDGTSVMAPEPYLGPAFDAAAPGLEKGIVDAAAGIL